MAEMNDFKRYAETILANLGSIVANQANGWNAQRKAGIIPTTPEAIFGDLKAYLDRVRPDTTATADAQGLVSKSFNDSRNTALQDAGDDIAFWEYSSLIDASVCPACLSADGTQAKEEDDLPPVPNPECEGGPRCRCIHVAVLTTEVEAKS